MEAPKSYEKNIQELEEILTKLESGDLSLDESIKLYQAGVQLVNACNTQIDQVEKELKIITP